MKKAGDKKLRPHWEDVLVFALSGATVVVLYLLAGNANAAEWFGVRVLVLTGLLATIAALRQRGVF